MAGTRSGVAAAATAPTPPDFTVLNQYAVNLNPGTHEGTKLLREFTNSKFADDEDKKVVVKIETAKEVQDYLELRADAFAWGNMISGVPVGYRSSTRE